jgi:hypothetical protein
LRTLPDSFKLNFLLSLGKRRRMSMAYVNEVDLYYEITGDEDEPCIEPVIFMKRHIPCV